MKTLKRVTSMTKILRDRLYREKETMRVMLKLYCLRHHHDSDALCPDCLRLLQTAHRHLEHCRFGKTKPPCGRCPGNCYPPAVRSQIRQVMAFSGPRMLLRHPLLALLHLLDKTRRNPR